MLRPSRFALLFTAFFAYPAQAGWTQKAGHGLGIVSVSYSSASVAFDATGRRIVAADFRKIEAQSYRELGITNGLTAIWAPSYTSLTIDGQGQTDGFSKLYTGVRARLAQGDDWVLSIQPGVEIPGLYAATDRPALGTGRPLWEVRGLAGLSFSLFGRHGFAVAEAAPRIQGGGLAPAIAGDFTLGYDLSDELTLLLQSFNKWPLGGTAPSVPLYEEHKLHVSTITPIGGHWSLQTGVGTTYAGRNGVAEVISVVGLWYRF